MGQQWSNAGIGDEGWRAGDRLATLLLLIAAFSLSLSGVLTRVASTRQTLDAAPPPLAEDASPPRNKSLVIVMGELRGGEDAWRTLYEHVLDANSADLAVFTSDDSDATYPRSSLVERAKHVWRYRQRDDWSDAVDSVNGTAWRRTHLPKFHDRNVYSYPGRNRSILFGGLGGHACDATTAGTGWCEHDGSGVVIFMLRHWLRERIRDEGLVERYDRFVVTRPDHMHFCPHPFGDLDVRNDTVWVPEGQEYGGHCDRHLVAGRANVLDALDVITELVGRPYEWDYDKHHNTERFVRHAWSAKGLRVRKFPRTMFLVRAEGDAPSRWHDGGDALPSHPGLFAKYRREWEGAQTACGLYWGERHGKEEARRRYEEWRAEERRGQVESVAGVAIAAGFAVFLVWCWARTRGRGGRRS